MFYSLCRTLAGSSMPRDSRDAPLIRACHRRRGQQGHGEGRCMIHLTYLEAGIIGLVQGVSEMFPISSLGHSVLIPALIGGQWAKDLNVASPGSSYLAFIVGLHVATAAALLIYF